MKANEKTEQEGILDGIILAMPTKGRSHNAFTISSLIFIVVVFIDFVFDYKTLTLKKSFDWEVAAIILFLPMLGMILHLTSKKIGWVINTFYYFVFSLLCVYGVFKPLSEQEIRLGGTINWQFYLFFFLSLISIGLLFSGSLRKYFQISKLLFISISLLAFVFASFMFFFLF